MQNILEIVWLMFKSNANKDSCNKTWFPVSLMLLKVTEERHHAIVKILKQSCCENKNNNFQKWKNE